MSVMTFLVATIIIATTLNFIPVVSSIEYSCNKGGPGHILTNTALNNGCKLIMSENNEIVRMNVQRSDGRSKTAVYEKWISDKQFNCGRLEKTDDGPILVCMCYFPNCNEPQIYEDFVNSGKNMTIIKIDNDDIAKYFPF